MFTAKSIKVNPEYQPHLQQHSPSQQSTNNRLNKKPGNYKCIKCGKTYAVESSLTRHLRHHCGKSKYRCPYCKVHLTHKDVAWTHIIRSHPNRELYCTSIVTKEKIVPDSLEVITDLNAIFIQ